MTKPKAAAKKNKWVSNVIFALVMVVLLFTPVGTQFKVWVNRLVAFSPKEEAVSNRDCVNESEWFLKNEEGETVAFSDLQGEVIIVNFWATWCPPCIAEKPSFQELYEDYQDKVRFLFVTSESVEKAQAFKSKHGYSLPIYFPMSAPPEVMESSSIPASFVIDRNGAVVVKKFRAADWNSSSFRALLDGWIAETID